jgi:hypothetical protein
MTTDLYPQLLPLKPDEDFSLHKWVIAPSNELAFQWVLRAPQLSNNRMAYIYGETGKTHLAYIFVKLLDGVIVANSDERPRDLLRNTLSQVNVAESDTNISVLLESTDCNESSQTPEPMPQPPHAPQPSPLPPQPSIPAQPHPPRLPCAIAVDPVEHFDDLWLFDMFNILKEQNAFALFTSTEAPQHFQLADLRSRMMSIPSFKLGGLDDELMRRVVVKRFNDLGTCVDDDTLTYLLNRIPRSFADINAWVARLDRYSSIQKRKISKSMVRGMLNDAE